MGANIFTLLFFRLDKFLIIGHVRERERKREGEEGTQNECNVQFEHTPSLSLSLFLSLSFSNAQSSKNLYSFLSVPIAQLVKA